jgi:hypothetical protein
MHALGKIKTAKDSEHAPITTHYQPIETPNPPITSNIHQEVSQTQTQPTSLPAISDESRILGSLSTRIAVVRYDRDDLVWIIGIQSDQCEAVNRIDMSEITGLLVGQPLHGTEEAQVDRPVAKAPVKPLEGGSVIGLDRPNRDDHPVGEGKVRVFFASVLCALFHSYLEGQGVPSLLEPFPTS